MLEEKQKKVDKESEIYNFTIFKISEIRKLIKIIKNKLDAFEYENYKKPYSKFFTLATAPKSYEILSELKLIIHIKTDENTMKIIEKNIYNLKALGRSEDFVDLIECKRISLFANIKDTKISCYSAYLNFDLVKNNDIMINSEENGIIKSGTINFINKDYKIVDNKRIFNKKKVLYGSKYEVDEKSKNVYFDGDYIVNFN
jgi:CRISPR-associated protein Cas5t